MKNQRKNTNFLSPVCIQINFIKSQLNLNFSDLIKLSKKMKEINRQSEVTNKKSKCEIKKIQNVPFIRPHSVLENFRSQTSRNSSIDYNVNGAQTSRCKTSLSRSNNRSNMSTLCSPYLESSQLSNKYFTCSGNSFVPASSWAVRLSAMG